MKCKKIFALLLSLCMLASLFVAMPVSAGSEMTVTVGTVEAEAGATVEVPVTLSNNTAGLCGLTLTFTYDPDVLTFSKGVQGEALPDMAITKPGSGVAQGSRTFLWDSMESDYSNGEILVLTFVVAEDAPVGDHAIDVTVDSACDFDFYDIYTEAVSGKVIVPPVVSGDMTVTVGTVEAEAGDSVLVPVTLSNNTVGLCGLTLTFTYDPDVLTFTKGTQGTALPDMAITKPGSGGAQGSKTFLWDSMESDYSNGVILVLSFDVAADAPAGEHTIDVSVDSACDFDFNDIVTDAVAGAVIVKAAAHECVWDAGVVTKPATHTEVGIKTFTCTVCGATYTEEIPADADAHDYDEGVVTTPATHTTEGVKTFTCICGDTYTESIPANVDAHEYDNGVETKAPTCTDTGVKTFTCICGDTYTEEIAALGHAYDTGVETKAPTCTEVGVKTFTCGNCGDTYTEEIPALGHDMSFEAEVPATCTATGTEAHYVCANCGKTFEDDAGNTGVAAADLVIAALGHSYGEWQKDDAANHKKVCSVCGDTVTEAHTWGAGVITLQPTRTEDGEWAFKCTVCEEEKTEIINKVSESDNITNVTVSDISTKSGQEIEVPVTISKNAGLVGLILNIEFDKNVLTLTGAEKGTGLGGLELTIPEDLSMQPSIFLWDGLNADSSNGEIVILKFKVADDAAEGEYPVSVTVTSACDNELNDVIVCANNGAVNVLNYAPGDLDADGKIGAKDIVLIRRFITAGYNVSIIEDAADVNNDGVIEVKDVVLIRRHIVGGFGVTLK